jgi:ADP-heptose:LPS heptosyltransferase
MEFKEDTKLVQSDFYAYVENRFNNSLLDIKSLQNNLMIAVVRLDNIGDHVLSSGFLKGLRLQLPQAHITVFVSECSKELYEHCPHIDRLIVWPLVINLSKPDEIILDTLKDIDSFSLGTFDIVINPRFGEDFYQAAKLVQKLGAPIRIAFEQKKEDTNALYSHLVTSSDNQHASEYSNILYQALFGEQEYFVPEVWYRKIDESQAHKKLLDLGWNGVDELLVLAPGASAGYRVLPLNIVMELIEKLHDEHHICVVIVGGSDELEKWNKLNELISAEKYINAVGLFTLSEFVACCHFTKTKLFVGTDSGPKHIAAAAGLEVIEVGFFPKNWPSLARGMWTSGDCWRAIGVHTESIRPETLFSQEEVFSGQAISSITSSRILASINKFWYKRC